MTTNTIPVPATPELCDPIRNSLRIFLVPDWIFKSFTAKYNLMEIHEYGKLRSVVSANDVAHLEILRLSMFSKMEQSKLGVGELGYSLRSFIQDCLYGDAAVELATDQHRIEIRNTVEFLVRQPDVIEEAVNRFKKLEPINSCDVVEAGSYWSLLDTQADDTVPLYKLVVSNDKLYIVVEEGFLSQMENKVNLKAFLTQVLKSVYAIAPISVVNATLWYKLYLDVLAAEA